MLKDPTEFRLRFAAWREGELPYEAGLPKYLDGKDQQWDTFNYKIPYIPEKSIKLTNAGLATGARISTNMLDSLANTAEEIGLPIQTAIGLATKESTLGNPTDDRSMRTLLSTKNREALERELWKRGIRGNDQYGQHLVPDNAETFYWDLLSLINYYNGERHKPDTFDRKENINNLPSTLKKGLLFYKDHPDKYNPGQKNYQRLVDKRGVEVMGSPEVLKWLKERNIRKAVGNFNRVNPLLKESKFNLPVYNDGKLPGYETGKDPYDDTVDFLKLYEGFRDTTYKDSKGISSIGYGFTDSSLVNKGRITRAEADRQLRKEILAREAEVSKLKNWDKLSESSKTALRSYYYNYPAGFKDSTKFIKYWNAGDYLNAIREVDAGMNDASSPGLRTRRLKELEMLRSDPFLMRPVSLFVSSLEEKPLFEPVQIEVPVDRTDFSLLNTSIQSPAPRKLNVWTGSQSPAYGGASVRMPSIQEYMITKSIMPVVY